MNSTYSKLFVFFLAFVVVSACKKEQPQPDASLNCDCAKEVSADFKMGEKFGTQFIELDTIAMPIDYADGNPANFDYFNTVLVYFSADYTNALSYEWQIGNNSTVQTTKDVSLYFNDTVNHLPVRLIVHAKPNLICFPDDDGVDTIVKYLTIKHMPPDPLKGKYYGYNTDNPGHYFMIEIDTTTFHNDAMLPPNLCSLSIKNLPEGKSMPAAINKAMGCATYGFRAVSGIEEVQPYTSNVILYNEEVMIFEQSTRGFYDHKKNELIIDYYSAPVVDQFHLGPAYPARRFIGKRI